MKKSHAAGCWAGIVVAAALVAGCSSSGQAVSDKSAGSSAAPSIDIASLDVGKYPTSPRPKFGQVTDPQQILDIDGKRLAEYTVVPFEIDRDLTAVKQPTMELSSHPESVIMSDPPDIPANKWVAYGFIATASTSQGSLRSGSPRSLNNMVVRYGNADWAAQGSQQMADADAASVKSTVTSLDGLPDTKIIKSNQNGNVQISSFTSHRDYVLYTWYETTPAQQDLLEPTIRKAVALQTKLIDQYPARPFKAERLARHLPLVYPTMDENNILIYALPYSDQEMSGKGASVLRGSNRAVYGPRGMSLNSTNPPETFDLLSRVGSTANAVERSTVYRAKESSGATSIIDTFVADNRTAGYVNSASPKGLPIAKCQSKSGDLGSDVACFVQVGRYVGEVHSNTQADAQQQISAQYVILTKADQNAN